MTKKRTLGRPRTVDPNGKAVSRVVGVRVTVEHYNRLAKRAARDGINVSELVRRLVAA